VLEDLHSIPTVVQFFKEELITFRFSTRTVDKIDKISSTEVLVRRRGYLTGFVNWVPAGSFKKI
jgi:hypothetical protein